MIIGVSFYESNLGAHADDLRRSFAEVGVPSDVVEVHGGSVDRATFIRTMLDRYKGFDVLYVDIGGVVRGPLDLFRAPDFDLAAYVYQSSGANVSGKTGRFAGVGYIWTGTMYWRNNDVSRRILDRWGYENQEHPDRTERENLLYFLAEEEVRFKYLSGGYHWVEKVMRPFDQNAKPVIEHPVPFRVPGVTLPRLKLGPPRVVSSPKREFHPEVLYSSHLRDYSGYAKASRNILFRISNSIRVRVDQSDVGKEPVHIDADVNRRIDAYTGTVISGKAPLFRFYTPKEEVRKSYRICSTMIETETLSPEFARPLNENYDLVVCPTDWNRRVFEAGGVRTPICVIPLGVDKVVYRPGKREERPPATLLTTSDAGAVETPRGYSFVTVFQPTFRKGIESLVDGFERAFHGSVDVSLVLVTSVHAELDAHGCAPFSRIRGGASAARSRVYQLTGQWDEWGMARLYRAFDCVVGSSRGEGWDLPTCEAAACGLPVIASNCTSHTEILTGTGAWLYDPDGYETVPGSENVSRFYAGQKFASFGKKSVEQLSVLLRRAPDELKRSEVGQVVRVDHTWDRSASLVAEKLAQVQGGA